MPDQIVGALIEKLEPMLYVVGLLVVLGIISFGGSIASFLWKTKHKEEDKLQNTIESLRQGVAQNSLALAKIEAKLEIFIEQHNKDLNGLGTKIRNLSV